MAPIALAVQAQLYFGDKFLKNKTSYRCNIKHIAQIMASCYQGFISTWQLILSSYRLGNHFVSTKILIPAWLSPSETKTPAYVPLQAIYIGMWCISYKTFKQE